MAESRREVRTERPFQTEFPGLDNPNKEIEEGVARQLSRLARLMVSSSGDAIPSYERFLFPWLQYEYGAAPARDRGLDQRVEALEFQMGHSIQPTLARLSKAYEYYQEKDPEPAAASDQYDWWKQLGKMSDTVSRIRHVFEDLHARLTLYGALTDQAQELLALARSTGRRPLREAALFLHDALEGVYSEDLTPIQVEALSNVLQILQEFDLDRDKVRTIDQTLRSSGFETVPSDRFKAAEDVCRS